MERNQQQHAEAFPVERRSRVNTAAPFALGERKLPRFHCCKGKFQLFGHYVHAQFLLLLALEFFLVAVGTHLALKLATPWLYGGTELPVPLRETALAAGLSVAAMVALGLYDTRQRSRAVGIAFRLLLAFTGATLLLWIYYQLHPNNLWDWKKHLVFTVSALTLVGLTRVFFYRYLDGRVLLRRVLVLGTGRRARHIDRLRRRADMRGFRLVGFIAPPSCEAVHVDPARVVTADQGFCDFSLARNVDEIVIAVDDRRQKLPIDELLDCRMSGIEVIDAIDFFEREMALIHLDLVQPGWLIHARGFRRNLLRDLLKRSFDIAVSLVLLILSAPVSLATMLAIRIEDRKGGSVFYRQERVGLNGESFEVIKFRSMRPDAEADGKARWAQKEDPRVTRTGAFIRKYRIDEIPQLWNVLRGDMSLVGPRPERPQFVEHLVKVNPLYRERHRVKPGLTGWAQLSYPYGSSDEDAMKKLQYDLYYIKNASLFFDLLILMQTVEVVLFRKGAR